MPEISTPDMCAMCDVTFRRLNYWVSNNVVVPAVHNGVGPGDHRRWELAQRYEVAFAKEMFDFGANKKFISELVAEYKQLSESLGWHPTNVYVSRSGNVRVIFDMRETQSYWVVDFSALASTWVDDCG